MIVTHDKSTKIMEIIKKITLKDYYQALGKPTYPKKEFIKNIATKCDVDHSTVRNWISGRGKPMFPEHKNYLSQITGIPVEQLWNE
jgi:hypothetical protein